MRRRRVWLIGGLAVVVLAVGGTLWARSRAAARAKPVEGDIVAVKRGPVRRTVSADGVLRTLTTVEVKSYAGGRVNVLAVDVGDMVKAGDLIAVIDPTDSLSTHQQALADLSVAKANLSKARAQLRVQGTLTASDIAQARAQYLTATGDLQRLTDATQPQTRAEAKAAVDEALASLDAAQKDLERLSVADQPQAKADAKAAVDRYTAALDSAQKDLEKLRMASQPQAVADAQAAFDRAEASRESAMKSLDRLREASHPQARVQAQGGLAKARAELEVAANELERAKSLREEKLISQSELEAAQSTYEARNADYNNAEELANTLQSDQENQVKTAELSVAQAAADLASARKRLDTLAPQQSAEVRSAEAKVTQSAADLKAAQQRWATIDQQQAADVRVAEAKVAQAQAGLTSAQERWRTLDLQQSTELGAAQSKINETQAGLTKAEANSVESELRRAELQSANASVQKAQAQVRNAAIMLGYTTISAPRDGVILKRYIEEGTIVTSAGRAAVSTGTTLVDLGDTSRMYADVKVSEADLEDVFVGQKVEVSVEAFIDAPATGTVTRVDPQAVTETNVTTVLVEVEIVDPGPRFLPGLTASCEFLVEEVEDALYLPRRAVEMVGAGTQVKVMKDGVPTPVPVEVGLKGDEYTQILSGLEDGAEAYVPRLGAGQGPSTEQSRGREFGQRMGGGIMAGPPPR